MTVKPDDDLLKAGPHDLGARSGAPAELANLRDGAYSLHHVLPYRYPLFVGFLAAAYRDRFVPAAARARWPATDAGDPIAGKVSRLLKVVSRFGAAQQGLPAQFAWMGPNLFQGPSGNFRIDDPGSAREPLKPMSMPKPLWDALLALATAIDGLAELDSAGGQYRATVGRDLKVRDLDALLGLMKPLEQRGHGNALGFAGDDWLCLTSSDPRYAVSSAAQLTAPFKHGFRILVGAGSKTITARRPGNTSVPPVPVLWKLRRSIEPVPTATVAAPQLQP